MASRKIASRASRLIWTTPRCVPSSQQPLAFSSRAYLATCRSTSARAPAIPSTRATFRLIVPATPVRSARTTYSTQSSSEADPKGHEISERGTKIWSFEQINEITKNPGKVILVDTREPAELDKTGHIPGAINIPIGTRPDSFFLREEDFEDSFGFPRPPKDAEVVFYCKAGVRSRAAAALAKEAGWTNVGEYPGSWLDWEEKGGQAQK